MTHDACISVQSVDPPIAGGCSTQAGRTVRSNFLKLDIYRHLLEFNAGYDQVIRSLAALRKHRAFQADELDRFSALSKEARAATNSYLVTAIETVETHEAGRRFSKRLAQERSDEQGN